MNTVQAFPISDSKWKLAERLAGNTEVPKEALGNLFVDIIRGMETRANTSFQESLKEKIWNKVIPGQLESLRMYLLTEFCLQILGRIKETEIESMLNEHRNKGFICNYLNSAYLKSAHILWDKEIIDSVFNKAISMQDHLTKEMVNAAKEEGIVLPEPNPPLI